jgi:serine/threonine protein kinase
VLRAVQDVSLKLLLDAARGLAYMHEVDVVHGDVKSRNLLVFWEDDEEDQDQQQQQEGPQEGEPAAADGEAGAAAADKQKQQLARRGSARPPVWGLKWCDFGVSFRAAEAPGGIQRQVGYGSALLLCCCGYCTLHGCYVLHICQYRQCCSMAVHALD